MIVAVLGVFDTCYFVFCSSIVLKSIHGVERSRLESKSRTMESNMNCLIVEINFDMDFDW